MCEHSSIMVDGKEQVYSSKKNVKVRSLTNLSWQILLTSLRNYAFRIVIKISVKNLYCGMNICCIQ